MPTEWITSEKAAELLGITIDGFYVKKTILAKKGVNLKETSLGRKKMYLKKEILGLKKD